MSFSELGLTTDFAGNIAAAGYESPTELQEKLIPLMTQKKSVIIWTQSASGKTGAFLIPAIDHILSNPLEEHRGARILILTSRRDRVNQITYTVKRLLGEKQVRTGFIVSGRPYQPQMRLLRRPLDLMIATPGRLNDLVENNKADFSNLEMLIIDDLTAIHKKSLHGLVNKIIEQSEQRYPVVTFVRDDDEVTPYIKQLLPDAEEINIEDEKTRLLRLPQSIYLSDDYTHKIAQMDHMLDALNAQPTLIYTSSSKTAKSLADSLANHGHPADAIHLLDEEERNTDACPILIISDQEGVFPQVQGTEHIIHFELPDKVEDYLSRMEALMGNAYDKAIPVLVGSKERNTLKTLENFLGEKLEQQTIPGLEPSLQPRPQKKPMRGGGKAQYRNKSGKGSGGKPQQRGGHGHSHNSGDKQNNQQRRKGPYGRLNGGAQRKGNEGGERYEIGSWEQQADNGGNARQGKEKKVVIRHIKKRRQIVKQ